MKRNTERRGSLVPTIADLANKIDDVALLAPFLSPSSLLLGMPGIDDLTTHMFPHMNNAKAIKSVGANLIIVHGMADDIIPCTHSKELLSIYRAVHAHRNKCSELHTLPHATHITILAQPFRNQIAQKFKFFFDLSTTDEAI